MSRRRLVAIVLVAGAAAGVGAYAVSVHAARERADAAAAAPIEASGTIEATEVDVRAEDIAGGRLVSVPVPEGARVEAGAVLAELERDELDAAIAEADARVAAARARVALEAARLRQAELDAKRARDLVAKRIVPPEEGDRAETALDVARSAVAAAEADVRAAEATAGRLRLDLDDKTIRAPAAGTVTKRYVEPGEVVPGAALLATVADLDRLYVKVYVPERTHGRVALGARAVVAVDAYPGRGFEGRVSRVASEAEFTPRNLQTKEDRVKLVFEVRVDVPNPDGALKPGMPADVTIYPLTTVHPERQPGGPESKGPVPEPPSPTEATP